MDTGLLQGIAEGLKSGIQSYREEKDRQYKRDLEQKKFQKEREEQEERLGLLRDQRETEKMRLGLKRDTEGNWVQDPESLAYKRLSIEEAKQDALMRATLSKEQQSEYDRILNEKKLQQEREKLGMTAAEKGLIRGETGEYQLSPEEQSRRSAELQAKQAQSGLIAAQTEKAKAEAKKALMPRGSGKPPTSEQFKTAEFAKRLDQAEDVFGKLEKTGYERGTIKQGLLSMLPEALRPGQLKEQDQAERNFVNAVLRRESGAAISPSEFASAEKQYFPRPGDTPEVLAQKKANREQVRLSLRAASQGAYSQIPTVNVETPVKQGPKVGTVKNGYRFKGGDPSQQSSWEKVK